MAFALLLVSAAKPGTLTIYDLRGGDWRSDKAIYQTLKGDTITFFRSDERHWRFRRNGNVKGWDFVLYCGNTPKWQRKKNPIWSRFGTWRTEERPDGDQLRVDLYTGKRLLRPVASTDSSITLVVIEAPEKKLFE